MWTQLDYRLRAVLSIIRVSGERETLEGLHRAIEREIAKGIRRIEEANAEGDPDLADAITADECEQIEALLGLSFVAAQSFITTVRNRWKLIATLRGKSVITFNFPITFKGLIDESPMLPCSFRAVDAINAVANYWKHADEWPLTERKDGKRLKSIWDLKSMRSNPRHTAEIAIALGLSPGSSGNLRTAANALGVVDFSNLSVVRTMLFDWAEGLYEKARVGIQAMSDKQYVVTTLDPLMLTPQELARCIEILKEGDAVDVAFAEAELPQSFLAATVSHAGTIVALGCIKRSRPDYTRRVLQKARTSFDQSIQELGYVAVDSKHRGNRLPDKILAGLLKGYDKPLFATTPNVRMEKALSGAGFIECGTRWKGHKGTRLSLWFRTPEKSST